MKSEVINEQHFISWQEIRISNPTEVDKAKIHHQKNGYLSVINEQGLSWYLPIQDKV